MKTLAISRLKFRVRNFSRFSLSQSSMVITSSSSSRLMSYCCSRRSLQAIYEFAISISKNQLLISYVIECAWQKETNKYYKNEVIYKQRSSQCPISCCCLALLMLTNLIKYSMLFICPLSTNFVVETDINQGKESST